ncbi:MAG: FAD-dependent thymidylate synthase [Patescibacteria group bacterium]
MQLDELTHITRTLPGGGTILVLNTGAIIGPEAEAMLQALHSRSIGGIQSHLEVLKKRGPEKFMSTYYVGYGHKSIGDCGSCTLFIEGVSMLAAKAVQDWPLYAGQESSTRYIDFAEQVFLNPMNTGAASAAMEKFRTFCIKGTERLFVDLQSRYPRNMDENDTVYEKAIRARAFDIMRGFLPAGATTNLAWHSNLRQVADKLMTLRHHPLEEVRTLALAIEDAVLEAFPNSFSAKRYDATETYNKECMQSGYYFAAEEWPDFEMSHDGVNRDLFLSYRDAMSNRPAKTELPKHMSECGTVGFRFLLDFGSFRDAQRHRALTQRMPLLTTAHGFHPWYLNELTPDLRKKALALLAEHEVFVTPLSKTAEEKQYLIPMGYRIPNRLTGTIPALVYFAELRSTRFVHPTLRVRAQQIGKALLERFADYGLVLHFDETEDRFDIGRGTHDIVKKE